MKRRQTLDAAEEQEIASSSGQHRSSDTSNRPKSKRRKGDRAKVDGDSGTTSTVPDEVPAVKTKRKLHTFEKAQMAYQRIQAEHHQKQQVAREKAQEKRQAIERRKVDKKQRRDFVYKKTKKGQPKLDYQVAYLLGKLERTISKEKH